MAALLTKPCLIKAVTNERSLGRPAASFETARSIGCRQIPATWRVLLLVKRRLLADGAVDDIRLPGIVEWVQVRLHRTKKFRGGVRVQGEDRLAADDDDTVGGRDGSSGPDQVFKLRPRHRRETSGR